MDVRDKMSVEYLLDFMSVIGDQDEFEECCNVSLIWISLSV